MNSSGLRWLALVFCEYINYKNMDNLVEIIKKAHLFTIKFSYNSLEQHEFWDVPFA